MNCNVNGGSNVVKDLLDKLEELNEELEKLQEIMDELKGIV